MVKKAAILFIFTGVIGAFSTGSWAFIFWQVRERGQYLLHEPVEWVIASELILAGIFTVIFLASIIVAMKSKGG